MANSNGQPFCGNQPRWEVTAERIQDCELTYYSQQGIHTLTRPPEGVNGCLKMDDASSRGIMKKLLLSSALRLTVNEAAIPYMWTGGMQPSPYGVSGLVTQWAEPRDENGKLTNADMLKDKCVVLRESTGLASDKTLDVATRVQQVVDAGAATVIVVCATDILCLRAQGVSGGGGVGDNEDSPPIMIVPASALTVLDGNCYVQLNATETYTSQDYLHRMEILAGEPPSPQQDIKCTTVPSCAKPQWACFWGWQNTHKSTSHTSVMHSAA